MTAVFITSTGTDIGKTFVACGMIRHLRARSRAVGALKPVVTGFDLRLARESDVGRLLTALGRSATHDHIAAVAPFRFRAPVSPDLAASLEGAAIDFRALVAFCRDATLRHRDALIIEGIGGVMVPLDERHTVLDWMIEIDMPLILVVGSYVGTLSHTLTALDVLDRAGLGVAAVVVSESPASAAPLDDTAATICRRAGGIEVFALPRLPEALTDHPVMAALADLV